jgi:lactate permease
MSDRALARSKDQGALSAGRWRRAMFHQLLTPVGNSLALSFLVAAIPIFVVLLMLGVLKRPAWQSSLVGLGVALAIALSVWQFPLNLALSATADGVAFALWRIVLAALTLYNVAVQSGRFDAFRRWVLDHLPNDRRIVLIVIGYGFGSLLEGVTGFGAPVAISASLLIMLGFKAIDAVVYALLFNTAPVAFGSLGIPITTLAGVTALPADALGKMIGRQLPIFAFLLPFYVIFLYGGLKSVKAVFPALLVAGGAFGGMQFISSNYVNYVLTDVLSALSALLCTVLFLKVWQPKPDPEYALGVGPSNEIHTDHATIPTWQGWLPWLIMCAVVVLWTIFKVAGMGQQNIQWPGLHNQVFITLYEKPYAAIWAFQPLATGTAVLVTAILTALAVGMGPKGFIVAFVTALKQTTLPALTVVLIVGLAFLMNYSGMAYTLGLGVASAGVLFPLVSAFVAANKLGFDPVLMAATNSSGGVFAKMISPQNIATGAAISDLRGHEGNIFARTFIHSILLTVLLGILVFMQQHFWTWMIPPH